MDQALSEITVLDLTSGISGAYCTMLLGDMGATVVKVERPGTEDGMRSYGPGIDGVHPVFTAYNRNKKSITLDLENPQELEDFKQLLPKFDVLVDDFPPGVMEHYGLSHETLSREHPALITLTVTAYGERGSYRNRPAYDSTMQAESGLSFSIMDDSKGTPYLIGGYITEVIGGYYALIALMAALFEKKVTGQGHNIVSDTFTAINSMLHYNVLDYIYNGVRFPGHGSGSPCGFVRTKDGMVRVVSSLKVMWERTIELIDDPVLHDPKYSDPAMREKDEELLLNRIEKWMVGYTSSEVQQMFTDAGITVGVVRTVADLACDPHLQSRNQIKMIEVPGIGKLPYFGTPFRMSGSESKYARAPLLGENNDEFLPRRGVASGSENVGGVNK